MTQDVLQHELDFSFTFSVYGADLAFIDHHMIKYVPEHGEDLLRLQIDKGNHIKIFDKADLDHDWESAQPLAISHDRLGNNIHEVVAKDLKTDRTYMIEVIFAEEPDDFAEKA